MVVAHGAGVLQREVAAVYAFVVRIQRQGHTGATVEVEWMAVALHAEDSVVAGEADLDRNSFAPHLGKQLWQLILPRYGYAVADAAGVTNRDGAADSGTHLIQRGDFGRQLPGVQ